MLQFCDNTGKIFSLHEYTSFPLGYETIENSYVFWIDSEYTNYLSVNNWYAQCIRLIIPNTVDLDSFDLNIKVDSTIFKLLSAEAFQEQTSNIDITLHIKSELTSFSAVEVDGFWIVPFYIVCYSEEEGCWISNALISFTSDTDSYYCPITIGAEIKDEEEALIINGKNMGVNLPKSVIKAIYKEPVENYNINEALYNQKIKEYLINYMVINGECGNYKSAIASLKWFEWGDKISISKLLRINNDFNALYLRDRFNISSDVLNTYYDFRRTTLLSLSVKENYEAEETEFNISDSKFWGEAKPRMESYFDKQVDKTYIRNIDDKMQPVKIIYKSDYYDYTFNQLGVKLALLANYYEKYFLPIHIDIFSAAINHQCFTNDIKNYIVLSQTIINQGIETVNIDKPEDFDIKFPEINNILLYQQTLVLDDQYNNFTDILLEVLKYKAEIKRMLDDVDYINLSNGQAKEQIKEIESYLSDKHNVDDILSIIHQQDKVARSMIIELYNSIDLDEIKKDTILIFNDRYDDSHGYYFIDDITAELPILFICNGNKYFNCILLLSRNNNQIYESRFQFIHSDDCMYNSFIISPRYFNKTYDFTYWYGQQYRIDLCVNGIWFSYDFTLSIPLFNIQLGKLQYGYYDKTNNLIDYGQLKLVYRNIIDKDSNQITDYQLSILNAEAELKAYINEPDLVSVANSSYYHEIQNPDILMNSKIMNVANKYWEETYIPADYKYNNITIYCDLYKGNTKVKYNKKADKNNILVTAKNIYHLLFNLNNDKITSKLTDLSSIVFDPYLMHDNDYWYVVLISKFPICDIFRNSYKFLDFNNLKNILSAEAFKQINTSGKYILDDTNYSLRNFKSYKKFYINRMQYISNEDQYGRSDNRFSKDDVIVARLKSDRDIDMNLMFNMNNTPKWEFSNIDINPLNVVTASSNTNMAIMSLSAGQTKYKAGYYNISLRYNIDDVVLHQQFKNHKFRIL